MDRSLAGNNIRVEFIYSQGHTDLNAALREPALHSHSGGRRDRAKEGRKLKGDTVSEDKNGENKERQVAYGGCHEEIRFKALYVLIFFSP